MKFVKGAVYVPNIFCHKHFCKFCREAFYSIRSNISFLSMTVLAKYNILMVNTKLTIILKNGGVIVGNFNANGAGGLISCGRTGSIG